jgi:hypothetical protein
VAVVALAENLRWGCRYSAASQKNLLDWTKLLKLAHNGRKVICCIVYQFLFRGCGGGDDSAKFAAFMEATVGKAAEDVSAAVPSSWMQSRDEFWRPVFMMIRQHSRPSHAVQKVKTPRFCTWIFARQKCPVCKNWPEVSRFTGRYIIQPASLSSRGIPRVPYVVLR